MQGFVVMESRPLTVNFVFHPGLADKPQNGQSTIGWLLGLPVQGLLAIVGQAMQKNHRTHRNEKQEVPTYVGGEQPYYTMTVSAPEALIQIPGTRSRSGQVTFTVPLTTPPAGQRIPSQRNGCIQAHYLRVRAVEGNEERSFLFYRQPLEDRWRKKRSDRQGPDPETREILLSAWNSNKGDSPRSMRTSVYFWKVDQARYPNGPVDVVDRSVAEQLQIGAVLGAPHNDPRLARIFDAVLAACGFAAEKDGTNCMGNFRFSFPYRYPGAEFKRKDDCHPVLHVIRPACEAIAEECWPGYVRGLLGLPVTEIRCPDEGMDPTPAEDEEGERKKKRRKQPRIRQPQPCYKGACESCEFIGTMRLYDIVRRGVKLFLVDTPRDDMKVAIRVYLDRKAALDYCNGRDKDPNRAKIRHWHSGEEKEWMARLFQRIDALIDELQAAAGACTQP